MIHEIAPHKWDNIYHNIEPKEDSFVLFFYLEELLVMETPGGITFPRYKTVKKYCEAYTYLFSLDDIAFYRVSLSEEDIVNKLKEELTTNEMKNTADNTTEAILKDICRVSLQPRRFFRTAAPKELSFAAITGLQLHGWYQKNIYCGACGQKLVHDDKERMLFCPACKNSVYPRINPAVIVAVTDHNRLLLTKYRGREYTNYALIAGFNEIGESLEDTVRREVMEEAGLRVKNIRYYKSQPWAFADNILAGYFCEADGDTAIRMDEDELSVAEWLEREDIPVKPEDLSLTNEMICHFCTGNEVDK